MANNNNNNNNFAKSRTEKLEKLYSDEKSTRRRYDQTTSYAAVNYANAAEVRKALCY